ncbi:ABC-F family ATP-binding cassette domain-containing protein [Enterococcus pallens]|uniref:ABC transporter ATP-binding protein n=1 Tax=Enterococcus pallens ATCC BAA-351 TaxID=1158607 RepID=R2QB59_9ENTE|nr:ABC-F family ATP-binding cassette domain-containing protein [Enterococcus pallens]EOH93677.1 ABC transporter ATP-binding protein [Enterococcus pallens ATCC BAA-351]EOU24517.1 ABC transporter ATP-binding protein [Enterococcus pallens ATCC BAA-351]OJG78597.1 ABC transporter ATP-binding protein [Enterococcus pallens]
MMNLVDITQQFGDKLLYEKINAQINKGEHVGLIGRNGAGKSTLIKIITGEILPDEGQIVVSPKFHVGYLDQYVNVDETLTIQEFLQTAFAEDIAKEAEIIKLYEDYATDMDDRLLERAGKLQNELDQGEFYQMNTLIDELATGLGINILGMDSPLKNLSGGQRSKILLAKLLLEKPDLLILDEPTNHLDDDHVHWLTDFLKDFPGTFLVVSHDQDFLNAVTTHIMDIEFGQLTKYTGNLEKASKQKELRAETYMRQYEAQQTHIKKTEEYIRKYKAGSRSTMAKSREKQLAKVERLTPPSDAPTPNIVFEPVPLVTTLALETDELLVGYDKPLLAPLQLTIRYGEKVALRGFNGIGKSTLIKTLIGEIPALGGSFHFPNHTKINYFSQELAWENPLETPFQYLSNRYPKANNKELRRQLSRSGLSSQLAQQSLKTLSGGEQTKVKLADMTMIKSNFLILDEPTNHIDQATKENLQLALEKFPGTVVVVSHENGFYEDFVDRVIVLGEE